MRTEKEIVRMRRRISTMMGHLQRIPPPWTIEQQQEWNKLFEINKGIMWCLGSHFVIFPFELSSSRLKSPAESQGGSQQ